MERLHCPWADPSSPFPPPPPSVRGPFDHRRPGPRPPGTALPPRSFERPLGQEGGHRRRQEVATVDLDFSPALTAGGRPTRTTTRHSCAWTFLARAPSLRPSVLALSLHAPPLPRFLLSSFLALPTTAPTHHPPLSAISFKPRPGPS